MASSQLNAIAKSLSRGNVQNGKDREISRLQKALNAEHSARLAAEAENARLREALETIRLDKTEVWDDYEKMTVVVPLDEIDRAKIINVALGRMS